jgi:hypothetical protein
MTTHLQLAPDPDTLRLGSGTERAIRVVLADDHALMRRSLRRLLDDDQGVDRRLPGRRRRPGRGSADRILRRLPGAGAREGRVGACRPASCRE